MRCRIESCPLPVRIKKRRLCNTHYLRILRHGDPHYRKIPQHELPCTVDGCDARRYVRGLCSKHGDRMRVHGSVDIPRPVEKHGYANSRTYLAWQNMKARCKREEFARVYQDVSVCDRWANSFAAFLEDMGECVDGMTLDRIDPTKGYEPDNCRWADATMQVRNVRMRRDNTSGHKGVSWDSSRHRWRAYMARYGVRTELGYYRTRELAINARHEATEDDIQDGVYPCCAERQAVAA